MKQHPSPHNIQWDSESKQLNHSHTEGKHNSTNIISKSKEDSGTVNINVLTMFFW